MGRRLQPGNWSWVDKNQADTLLGVVTTTGVFWARDGSK